MHEVPGARSSPSLLPMPTSQPRWDRQDEQGGCYRPGYHHKLQPASPICRGMDIGQRLSFRVKPGRCTQSSRYHTCMQLRKRTGCDLILVRSSVEVGSTGGERATVMRRWLPIVPDSRPAWETGYAIDALRMIKTTFCHQIAFAARLDSWITGVRPNGHAGTNPLMVRRSFPGRRRDGG